MAEQREANAGIPPARALLDAFRQRRMGGRVGMGFFDFIGDVFGAVSSPFAAVIDAGAKLLGLPPAITDALKAAVGAATGDVFTLLDGSSKLLQDLAGKPAETEYVSPPKDEAFGGTDGWAATSELEGGSLGPASSPTPTDSSPGPASSPSVDGEAVQALETLRSSFDSANRDHGLFGWFGDKVITEKELRETAEDPDGSPALKRAARYLLDHPDLLDSVARSKDGNDRGIAPADLDLALEDARAGRLSGTSSPDKSPSSGGVSSTDDDELSALRTLQDSFEGINTQFNILFGRDKVLSQDELEKAAASPDSSPALKRALRYILDHPDLLDRLLRSKDPATDVTGISRNDITLAIEDAQRSGGTGKSTGTGNTSGSGKTSGSSGSTSSSGSTKKSSTSSSKSKDPSITDILNDKSLSVEEKIEMILLVLENRADDQMLDVTRQLDDNDSKKTAKDDRKKQAQLDKVDRDLNFKMEKIVKRKEQLSNLLSTMEMKFASMAQTAIANMGR